MGTAFLQHRRAVSTDVHGRSEREPRLGWVAVWRSICYRASELVVGGACVRLTVLIEYHASSQTLLDDAIHQSRSVTLTVLTSVVQIWQIYHL
jgi:hypothetical protein